MIGYSLVIAAALVALIACVVAVRRLEGRARRPWILFAAATTLPLAAQIVATSARATDDPASSTLIALLHLGFHSLFAAGAVLGFRPEQKGGVAAEIALDGSMILAGAAIAVQRFVIEPLATFEGAGPGEITLILVGQLTAVGAVFATGHHILRPEQSLLGRPIPALAGAAMVFLLANGFAAGGAGAVPGLSGGLVYLMWLAGWLLLATAGLSATCGKQQGGRAEGPSSKVQRRLRRAVVPGAALFLGAVSVDSALRAEPSPAIAAVSGLFGLLLALRIGHAIQTAEARMNERRELIQTRALVEVSRSLASATDLDRTLELVALWASRLLESAGAGIELLDSDGETLEVRAAHGIPPGSIGSMASMHSSLTGQSIKLRRPIAGQSRDLADGSWRADGPEPVPTAAAPLLFGERALGAIFATGRRRPFDRDDLALLAAFADQAALAIGNAQLFDQVRRLSLTDPLTGLANRRQLERDLQREFAAARRGRKLIAVLFDIDDFKNYNDTYGHLAGDEALRLFGKALATETRAMNLTARYGGDEFLSLLSDNQISGAEIFVRRARAQFEYLMAEHSQPPVTVSAGIAELRPEMRTVDELIAEADRALYASKAEKPARSTP